MTKADLVAKVAETGITKKQAAAAVDAMIAAIKESLSKGEKVSLVGFGSFSVKQRKARIGRNPRTGRPLHRAGLTREEASDLRVRLTTFEDDWNAPGMDAYDDL
jgi:DNA-binding protein HU-beta